MKFCIIIDIDKIYRLSGYSVVTSGEAFKTIGVGVVHFSVSVFLHFLIHSLFLTGHNDTV